MKMRAILALSAALLALGACGRQKPLDLPENEMVQEPVNMAVEAPPSETRLPVENVVEVKPPVEKPVPPPQDEAQMRDDADATGMTSRLDTGGEDATSTNSTEAK